MIRFAFLLALGGALLTTACSGDGDSSPAASTTTSPPASTAPAPQFDPDTGALVGSHDCVPPDGGGAGIAWAELRNPIYEESAMTKDMALRFDQGEWQLLFSTRTEGSTGRTHSRDWAQWSPGSELVLNSPDITRDAEGRLIVSHQLSDTPAGDQTKRLTYLATDDLSDENPASGRLAAGVYDDKRLIDAALAHTKWGLYLLAKRGDRTEVPQKNTLMRSPSGALDGPWELVGDIDSVEWSENYQLLTIDGKWHMLVTIIPFHDPTLYRMDGDPSDPKSWLEWTKVRAFEIPMEDWNRGPFEDRGLAFDIANSAYLCDARAIDDHFYLLYAGATELTTNDGRGHQKIGVARSTDLEHWSVPPG